VQYRAGDLCLPAAGMLVADSGRSIFLEQHFEQRGQRKNFRWEVPYAYIVRIEEKPPATALAGRDSEKAATASTGTEETTAVEDGSETPKASAAGASGGGGVLLPFANRPKTA
jgi:hypothetical protein